MDHNLADIDFENPLYGSQLVAPIHEESVEQFTCGIRDAKIVSEYDQEIPQSQTADKQQVVIKVKLEMTP